MILFLDTSALIKLVYREPGSPEVRRLWDGADLLFASWLAYPEAVAALSAGHRDHRIDAAQLSTARRDLDRVWGQIDAVDVNDRVAADAAGSAARHSLSGADAVHLASAAMFATADLVLATWDRRLARAAGEAGIAVAPSKPGD